MSGAVADAAKGLGDTATKLGGTILEQTLAPKHWKRNAFIGVGLAVGVPALGESFQAMQLGGDGVSTFIDVTTSNVVEAGASVVQSAPDAAGAVFEAGSSAVSYVGNMPWDQYISTAQAAAQEATFTPVSPGG